MPGNPIPRPLPDVDLGQGNGQLVTGAPINGVLQAGEGRLARQVGLGVREPPAHEFEERVGAERIGVVLVLVAAGDLEDPLADQLGERVTGLGPTPVRDEPGEGSTDPDGVFRLAQPGQAPIRGKSPCIEARFEREMGW